MSERRTIQQRRSDTVALLETQGSGWLATAGITAAGTPDPHVIAVAAAWTGTTLIIATRAGTRTARNLDASGRARLVLGTPQDAVLIDVTVDSTLPATGDDGETGAAFTSAMGWDPVEEGPDWRYFLLRPVRIQAYRGYFELGDHEIMRGGSWLG